MNLSESFRPDWLPSGILRFQSEIRPMTDRWQQLFDRATDYDVSTDDVRTRLEAIRDENAGSTADGTDTSPTEATDAGGDDV